MLGMSFRMIEREREEKGRGVGRREKVGGIGYSPFVFGFCLGR